MAEINSEPPDSGTGGYFRLIRKVKGFLLE